MNPMSNQNNPWSDPNQPPPPPPEGQPGFPAESPAEQTWVMPGQPSQPEHQPSSAPQPSAPQSWPGAATSGALGQPWGEGTPPQPTPWGANSPAQQQSWTPPGQQQPWAGQSQGSANTGPVPTWGAAPPQQQVRPSGNSLAGILDFGFTKFVTPALVKVVYVLTVVTAIGWWVFAVIGAFSFSSMMGSFGGGSAAGGILTLLFGWIPAVLFIAMVRFTLEFYLANIRTNARVTEILEELRSGERSGDS